MRALTVNKSSFSIPLRDQPLLTKALVIEAIAFKEINPQIAQEYNPRAVRVEIERAKRATEFTLTLLQNAKARGLPETSIDMLYEKALMKTKAA